MKIKPAIDILSSFLLFLIVTTQAYGAVGFGPDDRKAKQCVAALQQNPMYEGPLGWYPARNQFCCDDQKETAVLNPLKARLNLSPDHVLPYFGSVCYQKVQEGCCVYEMSPVNMYATLVGKSEVYSCRTVHADRYCQEIIKGHITAAVRGNLCTTESKGSLACKHAVVPGETVNVTIHNNGCTGQSDNVKVLDYLGGHMGTSNPLVHYEGELAMTGGLLGADRGEDTGELEGIRERFKPDVTINYFVPKDACVKKSAGATDIYNFGTDGEWLTLEFVLQCENQPHVGELAQLVGSDFQIHQGFIYITQDVGDALASKDCEKLKAVLKRLQDMLRHASMGRSYEGRGGVINGLKSDIARVQAAIREYCNKRPVTGSEPPPMTALLGSDSQKWCTFREGNPEGTTLTPTDDDDDPRDVPGEGGEDGPDDTTGGGDDDDPRDVPVGGGITTGQDEDDDPKDSPGEGDDPKDTPGDDDDPRDVPVGGGVPTDDDDEPKDTPTEDDDDPRDVPVTIYVKAKAAATVGAGTAIVGQQVKLFAKSTTDVALPKKGADKPQTDHDKEPIQGVTDKDGNAKLTAPASAIGAGAAAAGKSFEANIDTTTQSSLVVQQSDSSDKKDTKAAVLPGDLSKYKTDTVSAGGKDYTVLTIPKDQEAAVIAMLTSLGFIFDTNYCRIKELPPNDPLYSGNKAWRQSYENQWAIKRVGLDAGKKSAWDLLGDNPQPVTVAVIDTGLDWNHLDFDWDNLWQNPGEIPDNGMDDDNNGYVDDVIGWNFYGRDNKPWDHDGHGTVVAGIIGADSDNNIGISGINPHARIMVLKAINAFGHSRASFLAKAIVYAVDNGAKIINMSVGGPEITAVEREAINYAVSRGVLLVVASGNSAVDIAEYGIAGMEEVLTVGATDLEDKHATFSNWGAEVDLAAPGIEVLSLRARRTDTMRDIEGVEYENGANYVGEDKRYYRASGTSFAAPIVTGVASLVLSKYPELTGADVAKLLKQTADDADTPGLDQFSGYGIVNAIKALSTDLDYYIDARLTHVEIAQGDKGPVVLVKGTADANRFAQATIAIGAGEDPTSWKSVDSIKSVAREDTVGTIDAEELRSSTVWIIRLTVEHEDGSTREARFRLSLG